MDGSISALGAARPEVSYVRLFSRWRERGTLMQSWIILRYYLLGMSEVCIAFMKRDFVIARTEA